MRRFGLLSVLIAAICACAFAQVPLTGGGKSTLKDIENTPTLVTVVLKGGAKDSNLRVAKIGGDFVDFLTQTGEHVSYLNASITEVQVQDGAVETRKIVPLTTRVLNQEERLIVASAWRQAKTLFDSANDDQPVKMDAASLLALVRDDELDPEAIAAQQQAAEYLTAFLTGDDLQIALDAALRLYLAGETNINTGIIDQALLSGNRELRIAGAQLAGLLDYKAAQDTLFEQRRHRTAEIAAAATLALGRIGAPIRIEDLLTETAGMSEERANAAMHALIALDGDEAKAACAAAVTKVQGVGPDWMRLVYVLYSLDDPLAVRLLKDQGMQNAVMKRPSALLLAEKADWDAVQWLREKLDAKDDPDLLNLLYRADAACALYKGGQPFAATEMQKLLNLDPALVIASGLTEEARRDVVRQVAVALVRDIARIADRKLLPVIQPVIQSSDRALSLEACKTALAIANEGYHDRLAAYRTD